MDSAGTAAATVVARFFAKREAERVSAIEARRGELLAALPAIRVLLRGHGVTRVWLFGSLAWGRVHESSDIDLAVEGLAGGDLFRVQGELLSAAPASIDLVRIEEAPFTLVRRIQQEGRVLLDARR